MTEQEPPVAPELPHQVRGLLSQPDTWAEPPPELPGQIRQAMLRAGAPATPTAHQTAAPVEIPRTRHSRRAGRVQRSGRPRLWLGIAAAVVAVLALTLGFTVLRSAPPDAVAALTATELAPGASGRAEFRDTPSGFRIDLDIRGLAPAAPGTYYQAWLKNAAGELVTIGTFHARSGGEDIVLWSAVDPGDYPTLTVTLQQEGAGAASSGKVVLKGTIG